MKKGREGGRKRGGGGEKERERERWAWLEIYIRERNEQITPGHNQ